MNNNWTGASWFQSQCHWLLQRNFEASIGVHICIMCGKELTRKTPLQGVYTVYTVYIDIRYRYSFIMLYIYICVSPGTKWKTQQQSPSVWRAPPLSPILTYLIWRSRPNPQISIPVRCVEELASLSEPLSSSSCLQILEMEGSLSPWDFSCQAHYIFSTTSDCGKGRNRKDSMIRHVHFRGNTSSYCCQITRNHEKSIKQHHGMKLPALLSDLLFRTTCQHHSVIFTPSHPIEEPSESDSWPSAA